MSQSDSPCIGVCTTLYDTYCAGCGRHFLEVSNWNTLPDEQKQQIWQRIEAEGTAWRFDPRYKDRLLTRR